MVVESDGAIAYALSDAPTLLDSAGRDEARSNQPS